MWIRESNMRRAKEYESEGHVSCAKEEEALACVLLCYRESELDNAAF